MLTNLLFNKVIENNNIPNHVAIIMDGNRSWAKQNNLEFSDGYKIGIDKIETMIDCAIKINLHVLTLYAFSSENWNRNEIELDYLMSLLRHYLSDNERNKMISKNIKFIK